MKPTAPAVFIGMQEGFAHIAAIELWNLTACIGPYCIGSTLSRRMIEDLGYSLPSVQ